MKLAQLFLVIMVSAVVAYAANLYFQMQPKIAATTTESAYDRVLRTGVIRCGYADWPPYVFVKDPTTGKISGILPEVIEAIADKLKLKVEWTENTGWGSLTESLRDHRIDAFCAGSFATAERGRYLTFLSPLFYSPIYPYTRVDDHRFDTDISLANSPDIRISAMDGEISDVITKRSFPKAQEISVPQMGQITDILVNVGDNKADVVFTEPSFANDYIKANPGKLRRAQDKPMEAFATDISVEIHEQELRDMLDSAQLELQNQGVVDQIISKYNTDPTVFLRIAKPYTQP